MYVDWTPISDYDKLWFRANDLGITFHLPESEGIQPFTASLTACDDIDCSFHTEIAFAQGGCWQLDHFRNALDAECGDFSYDSDALTPFFKAGFLGNGTGLREDVLDKVGADEYRRIMYLERVSVHPQIASPKLAKELVLAIRHLIAEIGREEELAVVAVLGAHHEERRKGKVVERYFRSLGFEPTVGETGPSFFLHPYANDFDPNKFGWDVKVRTLELAQKKRNWDIRPN